MRTTLGVFTAITAAMLAVSVAWAGDRAEPTLDAGLDVSSRAQAEVQAEAGSTSMTGGSSTSVAGTSSSTVTTIPTTSSTSTPAGSTSTTVKERTESSSGGTFQVAEGVTVSVDVEAGILILTDVSAPGWNVQVKHLSHDRIRIEFDKDGSEARFEIRIKSDGRLEVEIKRS